MSQWSKTDNAANSVQWAVAGFNKVANTSNKTTFYANATMGAFVANVAIGQFGIDPSETTSNKKIAHAGWNIRKEGEGGRAGRITYETIVAMGSITGDGDGVLMANTTSNTAQSIG
jgi:hypothetical protein